MLANSFLLCWHLPVYEKVSASAWNKLVILTVRRNHCAVLYSLSKRCTGIIAVIEVNLLNVTVANRMIKGEGQGLWGCRDISARVAADVIKVAVSQGNCHNLDTAKAAKAGDRQLLHRVFLKMWLPEYKSILVHSDNRYNI